MSGDYATQMTLYHNIFLVCGIAALCFFALAIVLFFVLKIPRVFGELTGRLARKAIEEMKEENGYTGRLTPSGGLDGKKKKRFGKKKTMTAETAPPPVQQAPPGQQMPVRPEQPAYVHQGDSETTIINDGAGETVVMNDGAAQTDVLNRSSLPGAGGTQTNILPQNEADYGTVLLSQQMSTEFVILRSIVEVHAEEVRL